MAKREEQKRKESESVPGPEAKRLKLDGDWQDAVKRAVQDPDEDRPSESQDEPTQDDNES